MKDPKDIFRQFSPQAKKVLITSQQVAESMGRGIGSEHLLIALAITPQTIAAEVLKEYAITLEQVRLVISLNNLWSRSESGLSAEMKQVLKVALRLAAEFRHDTIEPEHLLLAITRIRDARAYQVIARVGVDPEHIRRQLETILGTNANLRMLFEPELSDDEPTALDHNHPSQTQPDHEHDHLHNFSEPSLSGSVRTAPSRKKGKVLEAYATDLVADARAGKLDPMIGRKAELERLIHVILRRTKNNPVLLGEPGVGKTAIVEGLAAKIAAGQVPQALTDHRILRLDLAALVAGTMYRGQFEERLKRVMDEVRKDPKIILFIDELHTLVGTGNAEGAMDASNILKPALARGELRLIGATTLDDWRRHIENDPAFERRFTPILIDPPTVAETIEILEGLRSHYERHHAVSFDDSALVAAAELADRYLPDRALPDKAIDLIDEAAASKKLIGRQASDRQIQKIKQDLSILTHKKETALARGEFDAASRTRAKEIALRQRLAALKAAAKNNRPQINRNDIARLVAKLTGIPISHFLDEERDSLRNLAQQLQAHVLGQERAILAVSAALKRAATGLRPAHRPLGSFLFLGPTGVGKTELARQLARAVFGSPDAFIKLDMSEFMERHTISRLVGAPAGYVGYEDGGKLTDIVRRRPYSLLLFDEIEKAHPDFQHLLLQILEDGVITDAKGRRINFAHTIVILTSNLGSQEFGHLQALGFQTTTPNAAESMKTQYQELSDRVLEQVREFFSPEFLNRLDDLIIFEPLTPKTIRAITDLQINELSDRLTRQGYQIEVTNRARNHIARVGFDLEYGARPIRRTITHLIETPLAELILNCTLLPGGKVIVDEQDGNIKIRTRKARGAASSKQ